MLGWARASGYRRASLCASSNKLFTGWATRMWRRLLSSDRCVCVLSSWVQAGQGIVCLNKGLLIHLCMVSAFSMRVHPCRASPCSRPRQARCRQLCWQGGGQRLQTCCQGWSLAGRRQCAVHGEARTPTPCLPSLLFLAPCPWPLVQPSSWLLHATCEYTLPTQPLSCPTLCI